MAMNDSGYDPTTTNPDGTPIQTQPIKVDVTGTPDNISAPAVLPVNGSAPATATPGTDWASIISKAFPAVANLINSSNAQGQSKDQQALIQGMTDKYGAIANPYGAYRDAAAQKLAALQADPSSIVNTPGYQFSLQQGLGAVANRDNRSFGVGAGSTNPDLMNFAQGLASKTYNDTINQYSAQAGVGQSTAPAAGIYASGMQGIAQNAAAANAAQGSTLTNAGTAVGALLPAGTALLKQLTAGGMPLAQATQLVKGIPGMTSSQANLPSSNPLSAGAGNPGTPATDLQGTTPADTSAGSGWYTDSSGNIVQGVDPALSGAADTGGSLSNLGDWTNYFSEGP